MVRFIIGFFVLLMIIGIGHQIYDSQYDNDRKFWTAYWVGYIGSLMVYFINNI